VHILKWRVSFISSSNVFSRHSRSKDANSSETRGPKWPEWWSTYKN